jgi:outer membrane protein, heavy metal efflux system
MVNRWLSRSIAGLVAVCALVVLAGMATSALSSTPSPSIDRLPATDEAPNRPGMRLDFRDLDEEELAAIHERVEKPSAGDRLRIPPELPGAAAPPLLMPRRDPSRPEAHEAALQALYPTLPPIGDSLSPQMPVTGQPLTLGDLQRIAKAESPLLHSAAALVRAADGGVLQAGLLPNPIVGFAGDHINQNNSSGMLGGFVSQEFVLHCKTRLARAVAEADRELADQTYRTIENEVVAGVRRGYFAVLAAQETMRVSEALARFADEVYGLQVDLVRSGQSAAYEPLQLRVLAYQSRAQVVQARNRYVAAWKGLAVTVGRPDMPPMLLCGTIDQPMPLIRHETLQAKILAGHSMIAAAHVALERAHRELRLAEANRIPNVTVAGTVQHDDTMANHNTTYNVAVGVPVPIFNRNQGNILKARATVEKAAADVAAVENELAAQLARAFERYDNQRRLVVWSRDRILPDQMQAYRGIYGRHRIDPERVGFGEIVAAQQTLVAATTTYLQTLTDAWDAVVELGKIAQADDLFALAEETYPTHPTCATCGNGACKHIVDMVPWPDVMPGTAPGTAVTSTGEPAGLENPSLPPALIVTPQRSLVPVPVVMPQPLPDPTAAPPPPIVKMPTTGTTCAPCEAETTFLPTVGPVEKSTKRRWFMSWPTRRPEAEPAPAMLPPAEESCCPPGISGSPRPMPMPTAAPDLLPAPSPALKAPTKLPDVPTAPATPKGTSLPPSVSPPDIFEGTSPIPVRSQPRGQIDAIENGSDGKIQQASATMPAPPPIPGLPPVPTIPPAPPNGPVSRIPAATTATSGAMPALRIRLE